MKATTFDMDAPLDEPRIIVRYGDEGVEMVELPWGLRPKVPGERPFTVVRAEGRKFPSHRCLVPASEFRFTHRGRRLRFSLADGDWFYFAGIWRPASHDWPEAYAVVTIEANGDVAPYNDRQMVVAADRVSMEIARMLGSQAPTERPGNTSCEHFASRPADAAPQSLDEIEFSSLKIDFTHRQT